MTSNILVLLSPINLKIIDTYISCSHLIEILLSFIQCVKKLAEVLGNWHFCTLSIFLVVMFFWLGDLTS